MPGKQPEKGVNHPKGAGRPFCDNTHKTQQYRITLKPVKFICRETREYWFCNCKHTKHRPFCDGSHKSPEVQAETPTVRPPR